MNKAEGDMPRNQTPTASGAALPPRLLLLTGERAGSSVRLDRGPVTIGTGEDCTVRLLNTQHPGARVCFTPSAAGGFRVHNGGGSNVELLINDVPLFEVHLPSVVAHGIVSYGVGVVTARVARDPGRMPDGIRPFRALYLLTGVTFEQAKPWFLCCGLDAYVRVEGAA